MKKLSFIFVLLLLVSVAQAAQINVNNGLQLRYPVIEWIPLNTAFDIPIHVYNLEDGLAVTTDVNCTLHVYNETGKHIYTNWTTTVDHDYDYEFEISDSLLTTSGSYSISVYCYCDQCSSTNTDLGGFVSETFGANTDGKPKRTDGLGSLAFIIAIPLILGIFMIVGAATMGKEHGVLKIILFLLSVPLTWTSLHFAMIAVVRYYELMALQNAIGTFVYWSAWVFFVLLSYFIIYAIWKATEVAAQKKKERLEY